MASTSPRPLELGLTALNVIFNHRHIALAHLSARSYNGTKVLTLTVDSRQCTKSMIRSSSRR